jgi:hypothetical protein
MVIDVNCHPVGVKWNVVERIGYHFDGTFFSPITLEGLPPVSAIGNDILTLRAKEGK